MKIDLHVHSRYSEIPHKWFARALGARECYTEPETIYQLAKAQGMTHVTITDHNRIDGALRLREQHPDDVLTGLESNVYFPGDGCYFHLLVWGLEENEFAEIERLRHNVYDLREYLHERNLAHAVAHATFGISRKLAVHHVEQMLLLFNTFEGMNSGRTAAENEGWMRVLAGLTPDTIEELRLRYGIEPFGEHPWQKGLTGGSDDHAGLFVARAYTESAATTAAGLLDALRDGRDTAPCGQSVDYPAVVFTVGRIAHEYAKERHIGNAHSPLRLAGQCLYDGQTVEKHDELKLRVLKASTRLHGAIREPLRALAEHAGHSDAPLEDKLEHVFGQVIAMGDRVLDHSAEAINRGPSLRGLARLIASVPAWITTGVAALPFIVVIRHLYRDRKLLDTLRQRLGDRASRSAGPTLVFADTPTGSNLPALNECRRLAGGAHDVQIVTSLGEDDAAATAQHVINLPAVARMRLPGRGQTIGLPSLLGSIDALFKLNPSAVYVLTPGPLGLLGWFTAALLNIPCVGIVHPAIRHVVLGVQGKRMRRLAQRYVHWFYGHLEGSQPAQSGTVAGQLAPQFVRNR